MHMTPPALKLLARALLDAHGLHDWTFKFDSHKITFGRCWWHRKLVTISKPMALLNSDTDVVDTLLHEIAHALTPMDRCHGIAWQAKCVEIGAKPERFYCAEKIEQPKGRWVATCPRCKREFRRFRRVKGRRYCMHCGIDNGALTFTKEER